MTTPDQSTGLGEASQGAHLSALTSGWPDGTFASLAEGRQEAIRDAFASGVNGYDWELDVDDGAVRAMLAALAEQQPPVQEQSTGAAGETAAWIGELADRLDMLSPDVPGSTHLNSEIRSWRHILTVAAKQLRRIPALLEEVERLRAMVTK